MKVGLIIPNNIWFCPFAGIYTRILERLGVEYDLISWNRDGSDASQGLQYNVQITGKVRPASFREYWGYSQFVKKCIKREGYKRLIMIGPHIPCFLSLFLLKWEGRFIIDYRDLSIDQKPGFHQLFALMLKHSYANVISSPGFKNYLPKGHYFLSHNFNTDDVRSALLNNEEQNFHNLKVIDVLTIGGIRDYESNIQVVKSLSNLNGVKCRFVGKGIAAGQIEEFCKEEKIENAYFTGMYQKKDEASFYENATFVNIFYPRSNLHDAAVSNRFYNSLIYKRPMITTKNTTQGNLCEKHDVGIALENCEGLYEKLNEFLNKDYKEYAKRCNHLLSSFLVDQEKFEGMIENFIHY